MPHLRAAFLTVTLCAAAVGSARAQRQASFSRWTAPAPAATARPAPGLTVPDSVRQKVGYQHWKGAAIGGGLGALAGLALALAAHGQCDDCSSDSPNVGTVTLAGAGLGGALGFLVGLASPRYRWVGRDAD